ncbi:MAG: DUF4115 domain-containing protein [Magnetococcus sp. WYHC-3]
MAKDHDQPTGRTAGPPMARKRVVEAPPAAPATPAEPPVSPTPTRAEASPPVAETPPREERERRWSLRREAPPSVEPTFKELGAELRALRLAQGLSLEAVAEATRLRERYLEALEQGDVPNLPADTFVMGFLRIYVRHLGLDENHWLERYKKLQRPSVALENAYFPAPTQEGGRPRPWMIGGGLLVLLGLFAAYDRLVNQEPRTDGEMMPSPPPALILPQDGLRGAGLGTLSNTSALPPVVTGVPIPPPARESPPMPFAAEPRDPLLSPAAMPSTLPKSVVSPAPPPRVDAVPAPPPPRVDAVPAPPPPRVDAVPAPPPPRVDAVPPAPASTKNAEPPPGFAAEPEWGPLDMSTPVPPVSGSEGASSADVILVAVERTWMEVRRPDGTVWRDLTLKEGERLTVPAAEGYSVKLGNAGGVAFEVGGVRIPPQGLTGQVKRVHLSPAGLLKQVQ